MTTKTIIKNETAVIIKTATAISYKAAQECAEYLTVSDGNLKLKPTKETKYIIWNLPAIITCPFATEHCKAACYAIRPERCRPNVRKSRRAHLKASKKADFVGRMIFTIAANLNRPSYKAAKRVVVRIHESGDFYSQAYADAWLEIAAAFADDPRVVFMAYTKSVEFFRAREIPGNMVLRYSLWDDTDPEQAAIAEEMRLPVYTAVDQFTSEPEKNRCHCDNCSTCNKCWSAVAAILCEIH